MRVARVDAHQFALDLGNAQLVEDRIVLNRRVFNILQRPEDKFTDRCYSRPILLGHKVRAQIGREATAAEDEL